MYTIPDLWREWTVGLAVGLPSIDELDRRWGSRWRSPKERQYYSTRKVIIDEVRSDPTLNLTLLELCKPEVCNALWGTGNADISGIGVRFPL